MFCSSRSYIKPIFQVLYVYDQSHLSDLLDANYQGDCPQVKLVLPFSIFSEDSYFTIGKLIFGVWQSFLCPEDFALQSINLHRADAQHIDLFVDESALFRSLLL